MWVSIRLWHFASDYRNLYASSSRHWAVCILCKRTLERVNWFCGLWEWYLNYVVLCHTCFSKENQVQTYMHARINFHAYSWHKWITETISRKKKEDYQRFTLNLGSGGTKLHKQSTGGCVRLEPATSSQDFRVASSFWATLFIARVSTCRTQQVWGKNECKGFIVDCLKAFSILVDQVLLAPID
jgi:hypothetical protein